MSPRHDSGSRVSEVEERVKNEIEQLVKDIWRVGDSTKPQVPFGQLFDDDDVQQHYEGLAATLKAAKKRECNNFYSSTPCARKIVQHGGTLGLIIFVHELFLLNILSQIIFKTTQGVL